MYVLQAQSVSDALIQGVRLLRDNGDRAESRNGPVLTAPYPVCTMTANPHWRVLSVPGRGDNPFFHLVEALWMLDGRKDLAPLAAIVKRMASFSDDGGKTQPGAYGFRWRHHFKSDQLDWAVKRLKADPNDRRVVISMWDGRHDPGAADAGSKDVPCNTHIYLLVRNGQLDMTVCCRSNDAVWGAHGANAVHFSVLQEYLAARIGVELGAMWQVSNNYHLYESVLTEELLSVADMDAQQVCHYMRGAVEPARMFDMGRHPDEWTEDLDTWWDNPTKVGLRHSFFRRVATPVFMAQRAWADKRDPQRFSNALEIISNCSAPDWRAACTHWLEASRDRFLKAQDDGVHAVEGRED